ncbi:aldehyde dehydrogenase family protein [Pseudomonas aeruginosa]|nr:aldehyde dehydrogenase family protein [Pseudomonas aeruginosa]
MSVPVRHLIAGAFVEGLGAQRIPVSNPLDNSTLAEIACASAEQIEQAVASARETFANWETPVSERAQVMLRYQALLKEHHDELAKIVSSELGKTSRTPRATSGAVSRWSSTPATCPRC